MGKPDFTVVETPTQHPPKSIPEGTPMEYVWWQRQEQAMQPVSPGRKQCLQLSKKKSCIPELLQPTHNCFLSNRSLGSELILTKKITWLIFFNIYLVTKRKKKKKKNVADIFESECCILIQGNIWQQFKDTSENWGLNIFPNISTVLNQKLYSSWMWNSFSYITAEIAFETERPFYQKGNSSGVCLRHVSFHKI